MERGYSCPLFFPKRFECDDRQIAVRSLRTRMSAFQFVELIGSTYRRIFPTMPKKFDTNPLDPDFPERAKAAAASAEARDYAPPPSPYRTAEFPTTPSSITEEETRRFEGAQAAHLNSYAFQGGQLPAAYQPMNLADVGQTSERKVAKTGMPERWLVGLPYLPFWIGFVAGVILLLVIPKEENKVRFHAAQGFAAQVAIMIVSAILGFVGGITDSSFGSVIFGAFSTIMMIIFAIKAWRGKPVHIEIIDELTNWLEEKIGPIKH